MDKAAASLGPVHLTEKLREEDSFQNTAKLLQPAKDRCWGLGMSSAAGEGPGAGSPLLLLWEWWSPPLEPPMASYCPTLHPVLGLKAWESGAPSAV